MLELDAWVALRQVLPKFLSESNNDSTELEMTFDKKSDAQTAKRVIEVLAEKEYASASEYESE
jgi:hypothetical protein